MASGWRENPDTTGREVTRARRTDGAVDPFGRVKRATPTDPSGSGGYAPDPGKGGAGSGYNPVNAPNPYGTESGPGILESWFNMRASGTDPAFEYASKRGMEALGNRYSAAGAFNSGAARQGESDLMANLVAQRMGQLDMLAGGASGERQNRLSQMFNTGMGLASGESGLASAYDLGAAGNMDAANRAQQMMFLNKAGVDNKASQTFFNNLGAGAGIVSLFSRSGGGGNAPYGNPYDPNGLMAPSF